MNLDPPLGSEADERWIGLRREIDEALEAIEQLEADVMEFFAELGGENAVLQVEAYKNAQENRPDVKPLRPPDMEEPAR